jgi:hypothetical protein
MPRFLQVLTQYIDQIRYFPLNTSHSMHELHLSQCLARHATLNQHLLVGY